MLQRAQAADWYTLPGMLHWLDPHHGLPPFENSDQSECLANDLVQMRSVQGLVDQGGLGLPGALGKRLDRCCRDEPVVGNSGQPGGQTQNNINIEHRDLDLSGHCRTLGCVEGIAEQGPLS